MLYFGRRVSHFPLFSANMPAVAIVRNLVLRRKARQISGGRDSLRIAASKPVDCIAFEFKPKR
jgi:hypothetical protein